MAKKENKNTRYIILAAAAIIIVYMFTQGTTTIYLTNQTTLSLLQQPDEYQTGECSLSITPDWILSGGTATGTLKGDTNAQCTTYANLNDMGWQIVHVDTLPISGTITNSEVLNLVGTWVFISLCGDCITNDDSIIVLDPLADDDGDGSSNQEEIGQGTDPFDPNDYPEGTIEEYDCNQVCISNGYISGRGPFDSLGWCNYPEVFQYVDTYNGCCCMPGDVDELPEDQQDGYNPNTGISCWIDTITPTSQADCSLREDCIPYKDCIYFPASLVSPAMCDCVEHDDDGCYNNDYSDISTRGTCYDASGYAKTDYCKDGDYTTYLMEYDCYYGQCETMTIYDCTAFESICIEGACIRHEEYCMMDYGYDYEHSVASTDIACGTYAHNWCIDEYGGVVGASSTLDTPWGFCCWTCVAD